jgi:RND superfamily putative drug exporter
VFDRIGVFAYRFRWASFARLGSDPNRSVFFAPDLSGRLKGGGFEGSNSEAERVQRLMSEEFELSPAALTVVFEGDGTPARSEEFQTKQERALKEVRELDEVRYVASYAGSEDERFISRTGRSLTR